MNKVEVLLHRLANIGIDMELSINFPWIYVDKINGNKIYEKFQADHGWTVAFAPVRMGDDFKFTDIKEIFKLIRKYVES